jgi:hypothetical protein
MTHVFKGIPDKTTVQDEFFKTTLSLLAFSDVETLLYDGVFNCTGVSGGPLPDWMIFNADNRTVMGIPPAVGVYRVEFSWTDGSGVQTAYSNFKITVLPPPGFDYAEMAFNLLTQATFWVFVVFWIYFLHF